MRRQIPSREAMSLSYACRVVKSPCEIRSSAHANQMGPGSSDPMGFARGREAGIRPNCHLAYLLRRPAEDPKP